MSEYEDVFAYVSENKLSVIIAKASKFFRKYSYHNSEKEDIGNIKETNNESTSERKLTFSPIKISLHHIKSSDNRVSIESSINTSHFVDSREGDKS